MPRWLYNYTIHGLLSVLISVFFDMLSKVCSQCSIIVQVASSLWLRPCLPIYKTSGESIETGRADRLNEANVRASETPELYIALTANATTLCYGETRVTYDARPSIQRCYIQLASLAPRVCTLVLFILLCSHFEVSRFFVVWLLLIPTFEQLL